MLGLMIFLQLSTYLLNLRNIYMKASIFSVFDNVYTTYILQ